MFTDFTTILPRASGIYDRCVSLGYLWESDNFMFCSTRFSISSQSVVQIEFIFPVIPARVSIHIQHRAVEYSQIIHSLSIFVYH